MERPHRPANLGFVEFVGLVAGLMALNALAIDVMLPALPHIGAALDVATENDQQLVIIAYMVGFGLAQIVYGPLSDRFGRKPVLVAGLAVFCIASVGSVFATSFDMLLLSRLVQGIGVAAPRVVALSLVRDCFTGREMGRVISLAMMVFMAVPIIAPTVGQAILLVAPWRWIFAMLLIGGVAMLVWMLLRLGETLPADRRTPLHLRAILANYRAAATTRETLGYMLATGLLFGALLGFITTAPQVLTQVYGLGAEFTLVFAVIAVAMAVASFLNAALVRRFGLRRLSHGALVGFAVFGGLHAGLALADAHSLVSFTVLQAVLLFLFGFAAPNFSAMALEPQGHIAGTASSLLGFGTVLVAAICGAATGRLYDGTVVPLALGYALLGVAALAVVLATEGGRLFRPRHGD